MVCLKGHIGVRGQNKDAGTLTLEFHGWYDHKMGMEMYGNMKSKPQTMSTNKGVIFEPRS